MWKAIENNLLYITVVSWDLNQMILKCYFNLTLILKLGQTLCDRERIRSTISKPKFPSSKTDSTKEESPNKDETADFFAWLTNKQHLKKMMTEDECDICQRTYNTVLHFTYIILHEVRVLTTQSIIAKFKDLTAQLLAV